MPETAARVQSRPLGVTLLSVVQLILWIGYLLSMLWAWSISAWADSVDGQMRLRSVGGGQLAESIPTLFLIVGVVYLVLGISSLMLSRGYFKGRERARHRGRTVATLAIAFAFFCLLFPVPAKLGPDSPFWAIVFNLFLVMYLARPKILSFFRSQSGAQHS
jgi:hypothetical protein